jgi:hypothetical protein
MTTRDDVEGFKTHRLWQLAEDVVSAAENATPRNSEDRNTLARSVAIAKYVLSFRPIEPYLFPTSRVSQQDAIAGQLDAILSQINGWNQDAGMLPQTVNQIDANADQVLAYLTSFGWPEGRTGRGAAAFAESADAYREGSEGALRAVEEAIAAATIRLESLQSAATALEAESQNRAQEAAAALAEIEATRAALAENAAESLRSELGTVRAAASDQRAELASEAETYVSSLRANYDTGNELVKKIADQSVGGGYLQFAQDEMKAYRNWNIVGVVAVAVAFIYLVIAFWFQTPKDLEAAILKLGITLSLVAFSAYALREAGKRQRQSVEARYRSLDTIALAPFSSDLDESQQRALRYLLGERLFGSSIESAVPGRRSRQVNNSVSLSIDAGAAKALTDVLAALRGAG